MALFDCAVQWDILNDTVQLLKTPTAAGHARARPAASLGGPGLPADAQVALGATSARFRAAPGEDDIDTLVHMSHVHILGFYLVGNFESWTSSPWQMDM